MELTSIIQFVKDNGLISVSDTIIIGLSGGPDSVFLLYFLKKIQSEYNLSLIAAHLDHEWRTDSHKDVHFCAQLCKQLAIPFITAKASELNLTIKKNGSREALARTWRRQFLESVMQTHNAHKIALAHHEQDQQETFFIRLVRGTTLSGLTGIKAHNGAYIRPLLQTSKANILAYLHTNNFAYLSDSTNSSEEYLRNRIRLNVIPELQKTDSRFDENFKRTLTALQETEQFLETLTNTAYQQTLVQEKALCLEKFHTLALFLQKRVLLHWLIEHNVTFTPSQNFFLEIQRFLRNTKSNSHRIHTQWILCKKQKQLFVEKSF